MISAIDWEHLRTFLAVLQTGGLSQAARARALSQPTVGRHIDALEQVLGETLFTRSRNGMTPTAAALRLAPHAEAMENAALAAGRSISNDESALSGTIRLTASDIMANEVLPAILVDFVEVYPGIDLEIVSSNSSLNLLTREADIAVRMIPPVQQAIIARKVGRTHIGLFAHRRYVERHGMPETLDQAQDHRLIGYDQNPMVWRQLAGTGIDVPENLFRYRSDSETLQLAMLRAGMGIGGIQKPIAAREPDLLPVLADVVQLELDIWLAMHERLKNSLPMRRLMDHLADAMQAYIHSSDLG